MAQNNAATDAQPTTAASLEIDAEYNALRAALSGVETRDAARWDTAICTECGRGDAVETDRRSEGGVTVERHSCTRCDVHGATMTVTRFRGSAQVRTSGHVRTLDLEADENSEYRGTC